MNKLILKLLSGFIGIWFGLLVVGLCILLHIAIQVIYSQFGVIGSIIAIGFMIAGFIGGIIHNIFNDNKQTEQGNTE